MQLALLRTQKGQPFGSKDNCSAWIIFTAATGNFQSFIYKC